MNEPRKYSDWRQTAIGRWRDAYHTFGHLWFEHARNGAISQIPAEATQEARDVAVKAITDALYNTMMIFEGIVRPPADGKNYLEFALIARVRDSVTNDEVVETFELAPHGEESGCMGFHFWTDGEFRT